MNFSGHFNRISMELPIFMLMGHRYAFLNNDVFMPLKIVFVLANIADHDAVFHLGLHCLPKYLFAGRIIKSRCINHSSRMTYDMTCLSQSVLNFAAN